MGAPFRIMIAVLYLFAATACTQTRYVTVEKIRKSLPASPVVAGFDIDETGT